jgi:hypothetical protein
MRNKMVMSALVGIGLLAGTVPAMATVITYNEAGSGDIDSFTAATDPLGQPTRNFLPLGVGVNSFTGTIASGGPNDSSDVIPFEVLANHTLTRLSVSTFDSLIISGSQIVLSALTANSEPVNVGLGNFTTPLSLGPGFYTLLIGNGVVVTGYRVELEVGQTAVSGVPEPQSWALLIAGFGLVGAAKRQRRRMLQA